jgi:predicted transcriptional regulator
MHTSIPSAADVRASLMKLTHAQVILLAERSSVPFTTLWKVRNGDTKDPRLETVRQFMPHVAVFAEGAPAVETAKAD